ncbi:MAG: hypothetical protein EP343_12390 [Deltaproteobacteria bacterium]|nr:MAG: hypothetical protein EP343_12390 [Deltaproteobacteria bacterium]
MREAWTHYRMRWNVLSRQPFSMLVLLVSGLLMVWLWPHPTKAAWMNLKKPGASQAEMMALWCWLWPILASMFARGRTTGSSPKEAQIQFALPTLPLRLHTRVFAETAILLTLLVAAQVVHWLWYRPALADFALHSLLGLAMLLPFLVAWSTPARQSDTYFLRPLFLAILLYFALKLGRWDGVMSMLLLSGSLTLLAVGFIGRDLTWPWESWSSKATITLHREHRPAHRQFAHDLWSVPWAKFRWHLLLLLASLVAVLVAESLVKLPSFLLLTLSISTVCYLLFVIALRPLASELALGGLVPSTQGASGDFLRACSILPIARLKVVRSVYGYAFAVTAATVLFAYILIVAHSWIQTGSLLPVTRSGRPAFWLLWPLLVLPFCMAGGLVANITEARWTTIVTSIMVHLMAPVYILSDVVFQAMEGPTWGSAALVLTMASLAAIPPIRCLFEHHPKTLRSL